MVLGCLPYKVDMSSCFPLYYTYKVEFLDKEVGFCIHFIGPKYYLT